MASLKINTGAKREVKKGAVEIEGSCVTLREVNPQTGAERIVYAYCLRPGETVTRVGDKGDDYVVEF